jgi:hypothetical protein
MDNVEALVGLDVKVATTTGLLNEPLSLDRCSVNTFPAVNTPVVEKVSVTVALEQREPAGATFDAMVILCACDMLVTARLIAITTHTARKR